MHHKKINSLLKEKKVTNNKKDIKKYLRIASENNLFLGNLKKLKNTDLYAEILQNIESLKQEKNNLEKSKKGAKEENNKLKYINQNIEYYEQILSNISTE